jgi:glycosyltransferase involved in cell wall biosynthesis
MKISFVVLTYNRSDALLAVLRSLARQCGPAHEVIVADDGSRPEQMEMLRRDCPRFACAARHVWHPDTGFTAAAARNLGAWNATGDYLVFLDGDCVPAAGFVRAHERLAAAGMFVNGSRVLLGERLTTEVTTGRLDLLEQSLGFWIKASLSGDSNKLFHMLPWPDTLFRVKRGFLWHGIRSCNLGVWRQDFVAVNGFDETFEGWGHEDADLVLRLHHLGIQRKNGFWATEVYHLWHRESRRDQESINRQKVNQRIHSRLVLAEKGFQQIEPAASVTVTPLG